MSGPELRHLALQFGGEILKDPQLFRAAGHQGFQAGYLTLQFVIFAAKVDKASAGDSDGSGRARFAAFPQFSGLNVRQGGKEIGRAHV